MGNAGRHHAPPYRPLPQPTAPTAVAPASEVAIPPGATATATWNLHGGRGTEIEIQNTGSHPCEFAGHRLAAGKTAVVSVRNGTRDFALEIDSPRGTQVRLTVVGWRPPAPPTRTLGTRKLITRDPKTHTISSIIETPVWVVEEPR